MLSVVEEGEEEGVRARFAAGPSCADVSKEATGKPREGGSIARMSRRGGTRLTVLQRMHPSVDIKAAWV